MRLLAHPFQINQLNLGRFSTVEQGTDAQKAQEIAGFLLTHRGERPIYQEFGMDDPSFDIFDESEVASNFSSFYDTIELQRIEIRNIDNSNQIEIAVDFE